MVDWIAQGLENEGYQTELEETLSLQLPDYSKPGALAELRRVLGEFAKWAGPAAGGRAHVIHPGTSIWAERPELGTVAQEFGLDVICPSARAVSSFANRLTFLGEAERLGIPHLVLSFDPIQSVREVEGLMNRLQRRFPFVLKSVKGGSQSGIIVVHEPGDLDRRLGLWLEQLRMSVGEAILFAERYLEGARYVSVPFARFRDGSLKIFPFVDASLLCRNKKVVEFCPAQGVDAEVQAQIQGWTEKLLDHFNFVGVGSLEFLIDSSRAFLIEGLARLNTGFQLWEKVEGSSAVAWQLATLEARAIPPKASSPWQSGVSVRLYAEDPLLQLPQPGWIHELSEKQHWKLPGAEAILSWGIQAGQEVPPTGTGLLGILSVGAQDRRQAITVARGVLDELWVCGSLQTNERFLSELLLHPWIREGMFHAGFIDEEFIPEVRPAPEMLQIFAALAAEASDSWDPSNRWAVGDQWVKAAREALEWVGDPPVRWLRPGRATTDAGAPPLSGLSGWVRLPDGRTVRFCAFPVSQDKWQIRVGAWMISIRRAQVSAGAKRVPPRKLLSLVSGKVHAMLYREGAIVPAHEALIVVESLRVLVPHALPVDVRIGRWKVLPEADVYAGQELAEFETLQPGQN